MAAQEPSNRHADPTSMPENVPPRNPWIDLVHTQLPAALCQELIDIPGNNHPRYIDALVLDGLYPHVYEWTDPSRAANLEGYGVKADPVDGEIGVTGSGLGGTAPRLTHAR
jgi:hypothetical protein